MIDPGYPVYVYRNLHTGTWSVGQHDLIIAHPLSITLEWCTMYVSETGRQDVIRNRAKDVHAWINGYVYRGRPERLGPPLTTIHYDPYRTPTFQRADGTPIHKGRFVAFHADHTVTLHDWRRPAPIGGPK